MMFDLVRIWDGNSMLWKRLFDLEMVSDGMYMICIRLSIWKGFAMRFQVLERAFRFGTYFKWDFKDLEMMLDVERMWDAISLILIGFSIW